MATATLLALAGLAVTVSIFVAGVIFGAGGLMARVKSLEIWQTQVDSIIARGGLEQRIKSLEDWRVNIRMDMHEISDILGKINNHLARLDERVEILVERRKQDRADHH